MTGPPDPTAALNERFTLYNADGKPVERMLHEMTADEVMAAVEWSVAETKRLDRAAEPARELVIAAGKSIAERCHWARRAPIWRPRRRRYWWRWKRRTDTFGCSH